MPTARYNANKSKGRRHADPSSSTTRNSASTAKSKSKVKQSLDARPALNQLAAKGVLKGNKTMADSLAPVSGSLETKMRRASLHKGLSSRLQPEEAKKILNQQSADLSPALEGTARRLSLKMNQDSVSNLLTSRPDLEDLERSGVAPSSHHGAVAPMIQQRRASLSKQLNADQVSQLLETRPDPNDAITRARRGSSSFKGDVAAAIAPAAAKISQKVTAAQVNQKLKTRPAVDQLPSGVIPGGLEGADAAPAIIQKKQQLESKMRRDSLKRELSRTKVLPEDPNKQGQSEERDDRQRARVEIAIALKGAAHLGRLGVINPAQKGVLKELILMQDKRVIAAVQVFQIDHDVSEMLDTLYRVLEAAVEDALAGSF